MLPRNISHRTSLLQRCVESGVSVHFIFEQYVVQTVSDIAELNDLMSMVQVLTSSSDRAAMIADVLDKH
jgi:hypothetical protein